MEGSFCLETSLTTSISRNFKLENLHFVDCKKLQSLRDLSSTVLQLSAECLTTQESIPNPFEASTSRTSSFTLIKWVSLIEIQGQNLRPLARLMSYLHFLLMHNSLSLGLFSLNTLISLCLSSSEVPVWFNNQGSGSSLELQLPPCWWNYGWGGFFLSGVFRFHHDQPPSVDTCTVVCDLHAYNLPSEQSLFLCRSKMEIAQDLCITSDQLWLEVKNCGLRLIYHEDEDVEELMWCDKPFEDLGLPGITIAEVLLSGLFLSCFFKSS
ncbi:disease resistance-like protein DSC1 isoform X2 [Hevea brasiliensis]|uniref:disease resistance-like protein DSC1 isoform X2 n=1 Tax=Hevea brasiliensis TaxID=3981 RepID=UPI0025D2E0A1|nr:disease resistance-like protein DSC1 isoform X2 [Hevea brasiliensis]